MAMARESVKIDFVIEGVDELASKLRKLGETVNSEKFIYSVLRPGGEVLKDEIELWAPYDTGQLVDSLDISEKGKEKVSIRVGPTGAGFYGRFHEYGTSQLPANPFMRPAFDAASDDIEDAIQDAFWDAVVKAVDDV